MEQGCGTSSPGCQLLISKVCLTDKRRRGNALLTSRTHRRVGFCARRNQSMSGMPFFDSNHCAQRGNVYRPERRSWWPLGHPNKAILDSLWQFIRATCPNHRSVLLCTSVEKWSHCNFVGAAPFDSSVAQLFLWNTLSNGTSVSRFDGQPQFEPPDTREVEIFASTTTGRTIRAPPAQAGSGGATRMKPSFALAPSLSFPVWR